MVSGVDLHDGHLRSIATMKDGAITLAVESLNNVPFSILLSNVGVMNVMHLWGGDIISDVSFFPIAKAPSHLLRCLFHDRITDDKKIADAVAKDGRKYFFALECSYGADIYATCDQMQIVSV
jgi:hypothetical protein